MSFPVAPAVVVHERPAEGEAEELLSFQRVMLWLRLLGVAIILTQGWMYQMLSAAVLWTVVGLVLGVAALQTPFLAEELPAPELRRRATVLLLADLLAVYLIGTNFIADSQWIGYYFYPLMSLEAALIAGLWAGLGVTVLSVTIYLAQLVGHTMLGYAVEPRSALASISLIAMTGGFMVLYADVAGRGRHHLRAMLHLTSTLARHGGRSDVVRDLDRRLHAALGARLRAVLIRDAASVFRVIELRTEEERILTPAQVRRAFGDAADLADHMEAGEALTMETDAWSVLTATLGLPEWVVAVTLVPIMAEGRWVGMLPVLWPTRTSPDHDQLRLLHGLAGQMGLAMARGELEQMRRSATVDPQTGLLNRRAIGAELSAFVARSERSGGQLAVLLLEFGAAETDPDAGDATLQVAAAQIRAMLRNGDAAGRQDDDRLLVIAADADADAARSLGRRIEAAVRASAEAQGAHIALGIATYPDDGPTAADVLDAADAALGASSPRTPARGFLEDVGELEGVGELEDVGEPAVSVA